MEPAAKGGRTAGGAKTAGGGASVTGGDGGSVPGASAGAVVSAGCSLIFCRRSRRRFITSLENSRSIGQRKPLTRQMNSFSTIEVKGLIKDRLATYVGRQSLSAFTGKQKKELFAVNLSALHFGEDEAAGAGLERARNNHRRHFTQVRPRVIHDDHGSIREIAHSLMRFAAFFHET